MPQIQYILPLTAASAVALNRKFLFLCSFTSKYVKMAVIIHFVCFEARTLAKQQFSFTVVFVTQLRHRRLATIAFILDI